MASDFTIADVLAWARTKPADERYDYQDTGNCALCQFLKASGLAERPYVEMYWADVPGGWRDRGASGLSGYPEVMEPALSGDGSFGGNSELWTFGALVERLEALCPETIIPPSEWTRLDAYMTDIELASA